MHVYKSLLLFFIKCIKINNKKSEGYVCFSESLGIDINGIHHLINLPIKKRSNFFESMHQFYYQMEIRNEKKEDILISPHFLEEHSM